MDNCRVIFQKGRHTFGFILLKICVFFLLIVVVGDRIKHRPLPRELQRQPAAILSGHRSPHFRPLLLLTPAMELALVVGTEAPEQYEVPPTPRPPEARSRATAVEVGREIRQSHRLPLKSLIRLVSRLIESLRITVQTRGSRVM